MLQISDTAKSVIKDSLETEGGEPGEVYRLIVVDDQLALSLGTPEEGDILFKQDGKAVLATAPELAAQLDSTIDIDETPEGARLVLVGEEQP